MQQKIDAQYIRRLLADLGITQEEFAREVGCSVQTVGKWLYENVKPGPHFTRHILQLAKEVKNV